MLKLDHVIAAVPDLDVAAGMVQSSFGWTALSYGKHPGGTHNVSVPLRNAQYLELLSVYDPDLPTGAEVARHLSVGAGWFGWAVQDDDILGTATRLGLSVREGSVELADGARSTWRIAGWDEARTSVGALPFFIDYGASRSAERAAVWAGRYTEAAHVVAPSTIAWVEVSVDEQLLRRVVGETDLDVRLTGGPPGLRAVGISLDDGDIVQVDDEAWD